MNSLVPPAVMYAGLVGTLLALIIVAALNQWSLRVFLLLALRLAIGWHFFFEGMHKIHSEYEGPTDTNKVFTSEFYFQAAEGPLGEEMRKRYILDADALNAERVTQGEPLSREKFETLSTEDQAKLCPPAVAELLTRAANEAKPKAEEELVKARAEYDAAKTDSAKKLALDTAQRKVDLISNDGRMLKAAYAAWVYGATSRPTTVEFFNDDVELSASERLDHIARLTKEYNEYQSRRDLDLGQGNGIELKRGQKLRQDLYAAKKSLAQDTDAFLNDLRTAVGAPEPAPAEKPIKMLDRLTRWGITIIGAGLLLGLFTRVWCVAGAGFLVMTYLAHPTVPWLPLPPMTEGNPLFVNKNIIEALALLALASFPTGRWLGLDALLGLLCRRCCRSRS